MKLEVLVSTMNQEDSSLFRKMNITTDVLFINQCNREDNEELFVNKNRIRMFSYKERGLSKSRNRAIDNSDADICVIADDDVVYVDGYAEKIIQAYEKYPDADIIAFSVPSTNSDRPTACLKTGNVDFIHSMKLASFQLTFKRESLIKQGIRFNELFGAGATYTCGEENILLAECIRKGLKIKYFDEKIGMVNHCESTWYQGFNEELFITKGAMFYEMNPLMSQILISQFAIRKWRKYRKEISFIKAYTYMIKGCRDYKELKFKR